MYQPGSYPVNPAYSNQNASYPRQYPQQYQGQGQAPGQQGYPNSPPTVPSGAVQQPQGDPNNPPQTPSATPQPQGYQHPTLPAPPISEFEDRNENPCNCCCATATAAKTLAFLNVFYLVLELIDLAATDSPLYSGRDTSYGTKCYPDYEHCTDDILYYTCMNHQAATESGLYFTVVILFIANIVVYFLASIGFLIALFGSVGTKIELFCSNLFMWSSFCFLGWLWQLLLFLDMWIQNEDCLKSSRLWDKYVISGVTIGVSVIFNGFVARGFRNMARRKSTGVRVGEGLPKGIVGMGGSATATATMPGAESSPSKMEAVAPYPQQYATPASPVPQSTPSKMEAEPKAVASYPQQAQGAMPGAPYNQQQSSMPMAPYGAVQQGQGSFPPRVSGPGREIEKRSENPCRCCCSLPTAAKVLAILNLINLILELLDLLLSGRDSEFQIADEHIKIERDSLGYFERAYVIDPSLFQFCMIHQVDVKSWFYLITLSIFISSIAAYMVATIGFLVAIFGRLGTKVELLCSNIFMWMSFFHLGWLYRLLLLVDLLIEGDLDFYVEIKCWNSGSIWGKYICWAISAAVWCVFNGLVGRGYRNMVKRKGQGMVGGGQPQAMVGMEVPPTQDNMPVEEAVPSKTESAPGGVPPQP